MNTVSRLLKLIQTRLPLIQAPMAGVQGSRLAVAACRAGALGSLPAAMLPAERLCAEIEAVRRQTDRPRAPQSDCKRWPKSGFGG